MCEKYIILRRQRKFELTRKQLC